MQQQSGAPDSPKNWHGDPHFPQTTVSCMVSFKCMGTVKNVNNWDQLFIHQKPLNLIQLLLGCAHSLIFSRRCTLFKNLHVDHITSTTFTFSEVQCTSHSSRQRHKICSYLFLLILNTNTVMVHYQYWNPIEIINLWLPVTSMFPIYYC